jgi:ribose 5-phosphate isomerase RpiB
MVQPAQGVNASGWEVTREDAARATETNITGHVTSDGDRISGKEKAIDIANDYAEEKWQDRGTPTEVKVRNMDGTWAEYRGSTYGNDPYKPRG